jgi:hypothetical protein
MPRSFYSVALILALAAPVCSADLRVYPEQVSLTGPRAAQRLLVVLADAIEATADRTSSAKFTSSNLAIATVAPDGTVRAVADGETTIAVVLDGKQKLVSVKVAKTQQPAADPFRNEIIPILTRIGCNSGACHGALAGKGGLKLSLRGYNMEADHFALTRQAGGRRIDRQEPARSLVLRKPSLAIAHGGGQKLEVGSADYQSLADWIALGAPGPKTDGPRVERIELFPPAAVLKPSDTMQVLVRAWYSDGSSRDVTNWAKFSSSEDLVAGVDPGGLAKVAGHGEAAITVWFSNFVAATSITSPLTNVVDPKTFTAASRNNFIDDHVLRKLQKLNLPPSPSCTDAEFIRRAFLDAAGILPTPEEVRAFLDSKEPLKRSKLIDTLLERPEFVDYWAYKWSDLLLITSRRLPQPAVWSFYQHVRQSVATNKPWDRFTREIITASGGSLQNGAANYFVLHKDISDLSEATAVTFLGTSITCARCHNHPLEKWTQDQYWAMANLFGRVSLKNGERPGDVVVQSQPSGEVPHLRRGVPMLPTPLDGKPLAFDSPIDRRAYLADWLTSPENPYFAKALVNRVWRNFMGRGLVEAEDDLRQTNPPTNAELFDALARDFVDHKYDVKQLIRTVMNSAAYQRSSQPVKGNESDDRFYSRYLIRRLSAEVILDAYSQVTAVPTPFTQVGSGTGGRQNYGGYPLGTRALQLPDSLIVSQFLDAFGRPERTATCSCERQQGSSVGQALHVNNGKTLNDKIRAKDSRVELWLKENISDTEAIKRIFFLALCREPTAAEMAKFTGFLAAGTADPETGRRGAIEDLFWSVLASKEFAFNR